MAKVTTTISLAAAAVIMIYGYHMGDKVVEGFEGLAKALEKRALKKAPIKDKAGCPFLDKEEKFLFIPLLKGGKPLFVNDGNGGMTLNPDLKNGKLGHDCFMTD